MMIGYTHGSVFDVHEIETPYASTYKPHYNSHTNVIIAPAFGWDWHGGGW